MLRVNDTAEGQPTGDHSNMEKKNLLHIPKRRPVMKELSAPDAASQTSGAVSVEDNVGTIGRQFNTACEIQPPRCPARRRSSSYKHKASAVIDDTDDSAVKYSGILEEKDPIDKADSRNAQCSTTQENTVSVAPCSSVYCMNTSDSVDGLSTRSILTEDAIRTFLYDYHAAYHAMCGPQTIESWRSFAEKFYIHTFQLVRPSGNPIKRDDLARYMASDMNFLKIQMISIDSITVLSCMRSAVVIYTAEHFFEYKGIPNEDRCVYTCVLELADGDIKMFHEHRSSGMSVPKETRWKPMWTEMKKMTQRDQYFKSNS